MFVLGSALARSKTADLLDVQLAVDLTSAIIGWIRMAWPFEGEPTHLAFGN